MDIEFRYDVPGPEDYFALFGSTGWNREYGLSAGELREAVARSWCFVGGSGRVVSDGLLHALIVDVILLPEWQGKGIGRAIMARLLERCRTARKRDVQLFCAKGKAGFYQRLGFRARSAEAPGMEYGTA